MSFQISEEQLEGLRRELIALIIWKMHSKELAEEVASRELRPKTIETAIKLSGISRRRFIGTVARRGIRNYLKSNSNQHVPLSVDVPAIAPSRSSYEGNLLYPTIDNLIDRKGASTMPRSSSMIFFAGCQAKTFPKSTQ